MSFGFQGVFLIPPAPLKGGRAKRRGCKAQPTCHPRCPAGPAPGRLPPFKGVPEGRGIKKLSTKLSHLRQNTCHIFFREVDLEDVIRLQVIKLMLGLEAFFAATCDVEHDHIICLHCSLFYRLLQ